jgi:hypothetical protein
VQETQLPALQTWLVPQVWPLATLPVELHFWVPVEQE